MIRADIDSMNSPGDGGRRDFLRAALETVFACSPKCRPISRKQAADDGWTRCLEGFQTRGVA